MHAVMRTFATILAMLALALPAHGASIEARRLLGALEILVSPAEGRTFLARDGSLLAVGELQQARSAPQRRGSARHGSADGYGAYEECVPGHGCRIVGEGHYDPYFHGDGAAPYPAPFLLTGHDLDLAPISHAALPLAGTRLSGDPHKDHWRILYERTGTLETNPAPLVATARLLAPLAAVDPVTTASTPARPVEIVVSRRNARDVATDVQELLNRLGHRAGLPDGLVGRRTAAAIRRFQEARGIEPTGRLTASLVDAVYLAADEVLPPDGTLVVRRVGRTVLETPVRIDTAETALGAHLFVHAGEAGWQLVTLHRDHAEFAPEAFGFDSKTDHSDAAAGALSRLHVPAEARAKLMALVTPGSILALSDERVPGRAYDRY